MPIYEYKCQKCGHVKEHLVKTSDPKPNCPKCNEKEGYEKQVTSAQFQLKGDGWYKTDFKYR